MLENVRIHQLWRRWVDIVKDCLKKKEVCMPGKQGEWCMIGVNGGDL